MKSQEDFKNVITNKIVDTIKQGKLEKYITSFKTLGIPENGISKKPYKGQNFLNLSLTSFAQNYPSNEWLTYNQANALKGQVKKGEHGTKIIFWDYIEDDLKPNKKRAVFQVSTVFNKAQTTLKTITEDIEPIEAARNEIDILNFIEAIPHKHNKTIGRAFYYREDNSVNIPDSKDFITPEHFYACYFHELTHLTGTE